MSNAYEWCDDGTALVQLIQVQLIQVSMAVSRGGVEGCNMLQETNEEVEILVQTITKNGTHALPYLLVDINIPKLHGTLTDRVNLCDL